MDTGYDMMPLNNWWALNRTIARAQMGQIMKMASYREVATKDVRNVSVDCLKPRQAANHGPTSYKTRWIYTNFKMRGPGSVELGESKLNLWPGDCQGDLAIFLRPWMRLVRKFFLKRS